MGNQKHSTTHVENAINFGNIALYFRGRVSSDDDRQLIYAAAINNESYNSGRRIKCLSCSLDGDTVDISDDNMESVFDITNIIRKSTAELKVFEN